MEKQKNSPQLRFPGFEGEWERKKLGEVSELITKGTTPSKFSSDGIRFIKIECFEVDSINTIKCLFIDKETHNKELKRSILKEGDILFAIAGATIGKVNIVTKEILPANTNQALSIVRLNNNVYNIFIYNILKSNIMQKYIIDNISVGAQPNLNLEQMNNFSFFLPSLPEQTKIATFFSEIDRKIGQLKQKKTLLEQYKKGVMQQLFSQTLRFKDDNGNEFPTWEKKRLGEILFEINEKTDISNKYRILSSTSKGLFNQDDYFKKVVASKDNSGYKILRKGQLVFSPQNLWLGNINVNLHIEIGIVSPSYKIFSFNSKYTFPQFCQYFLLTPKMIFEYEQSSVQGASIVRRNLDMDKFLNIEFKLPSLPEQTKIANFLSAIDDKINHCQQQMERMEVWKRGALQGMFV